MRENKSFIGAFLIVGVVGAAAVAACSGSTGPAGANGADGAAGPPGAVGATGSAGATGATGPSGAPSGGATGDMRGRERRGRSDGSCGRDGRGRRCGDELRGLDENRRRKGTLRDASPVAVNLNGLTSAQVEMVGEGSYLVNAAGGCNDCHASAAGAFLGGGTQFGGAPAPFTVYARNLTPDPTTGMKLTMAQFETALQTGADFDTGDGGAPTQQLLVMGWQSTRWMSKTDLDSIWMYLTHIPGVSNAVPSDSKTPFAGPPVALPSNYNEGVLGDAGAALPPVGSTDPGDVVRGLALNPLNVASPSDPASQTAFARGAYLVTAIASCNDCHTNPARTGGVNITTSDYLTGGAVFATPPPLQPVVHTVRSMSANLIGKTNGFFTMPNVTFETFLTDITQGTHAEDPHPTPLAYPMPWTVFKNLTLDDLESVYTYLSTVAKTTAAMTDAGLVDKATQSASLYCDGHNACPIGSCTITDGGPGECVGQPCNAANNGSDCPACQVCSGGTCGLPADAGTLGACVANGL